MMRLRLLPHRLLALACLLGTYATLPLVAQVEVPGGRQALKRLVGPLRLEPERFVASVNRALLDSFPPNHRWKRSRQRAELVGYLHFVERLRETYRFPLTVDTSDTGSVERFGDLAAELGYGAGWTSGRVVIEPMPGDEAVEGRLVARLLNWNLYDVAEWLNAGEKVTLELASETLPPPLPAELWSTITEVGPEGALEELAADEKLSMLVDGLLNVDAATRTALVEEGLYFWIYEKAVVPFFRYAPSLSLRGGRLAAPGDERAWVEYLGVGFDVPGETLQALLGGKRGRAAHIWHALWFAPDGARRYFTEPGSRRLDELDAALSDLGTQQDYDEPLGHERSLPLLLRSLELDAERGLQLPVAADVWWSAARQPSMASSPRALARQLQRGAKRTPSPDELPFRLLNATVNLEGFDRPILPRIVAARHFFGRDDSALTQETIGLLVPASETYRAALEAWDDFPATCVPRLPDYLLTVGALDALEDGPGKFLLITNFQGGVELLRLLARGDRVDDEALDAFLERWLAVHASASDPREVVPDQLDWLVDLVRSLPDAPDEQDHPPLQRRLLHAINEIQDPQTFDWRGLTYKGSRGQERIERMARALRRQGVPPVDRLVFLRDASRALDDALEARDRQRAREAAQTLREELDRLHAVRFDPPLEDPQLRERWTPGRGELKRHARRLARNPQDKRQQLERLLARELRVVLLAPPYIELMTHMDNVLFKDPHLIRKHSLLRDYEMAQQRQLARDTPWITTRLTTGKELGYGTFFTGHLGMLMDALAGHSSSLMRPGSTTSRRDLIRQHQLLVEESRTRWPSITPRVARAVWALMRAGDEVLQRALGDDRDGRASALVRSLVSPRRLEDERDNGTGLSLISPSERLALGLAALDGESLDRGLVSAEVAGAFDGRRAALGTGWRTELDRAGSVTRGLDGRRRPWVGRWPAYEALRLEGYGLRLRERENVDLKLAVVAFMGRHGLPGEVGRDLFTSALLRMSEELEQESARDYEGWIRWINGLDDTYFEERLRECFADGLYQLFRL